MQYVRDYDELFMLAPQWKEQLAPYGKFHRKPNLAPDYTCPTTLLEYTFNEALSGAPTTLVKSPRTMAMFYESLRSITADRGESWNSAGVHGKGSHVCFHDGHVQWIQTRPAFWVPEFALKEAEVRGRGEETRRITAAQTARRQWQLKQKRMQQSRRKP